MNITCYNFKCMNPPCVFIFSELRKWIDEVAAKFDEERKESKEKVFAAKRKVLGFHKLLHAIIHLGTC